MKISIVHLALFFARTWFWDEATKSSILASLTCEYATKRRTVVSAFVFFHTKTSQASPSVLSSRLFGNLPPNCSIQIMQLES